MHIWLFGSSAHLESPSVPLLLHARKRVYAAILMLLFMAVITNMAGNWGCLRYQLALSVDQRGCTSLDITSWIAIFIADTIMVRARWGDT